MTGITWKGDNINICPAGRAPQAQVKRVQCSLAGVSQQDVIADQSYPAILYE